MEKITLHSGLDIPALSFTLQSEVNLLFSLSKTLEEDDIKFMYFSFEINGYFPSELRV